MLQANKEIRKKQGTLVPTGENLTKPIQRKKTNSKKAEKSVPVSNVIVTILFVILYL